MPRRISFRTGKILNISEEGKGVCKKKPMVTFSFGSKLATDSSLKSNLGEPIDIFRRLFSLQDVLKEAELADRPLPCRKVRT